MRGLVFTLVTVVGCAQGGSETCDQYVSCMAVVEPGLFTDASAAFGQDGSCWKEDAVDCDMLCEVGMDVLMEAEDGAQCGGDAAEPGLFYYWRLLVGSTDGWALAANGRFEAPICPFDEVAE